MIAILKHPRFLKRLGIVSLLSLAAVLFFLMLDGEIARILEMGRHGWKRDPWMMTFRELGRITVPFWLILLYAWIRKRPKFVVAGVIAILLVAVSVTATKLIVQRPRPGDPPISLSEYMSKGERPDYSFPSGDTASAFALAAVAVSCATLYPSVLLYLLASVVGFLRVVMWYHYPSDALAGAAFGLVCGWTALGLTQLLFKRAPPFLSWKKRPVWLFALVTLFPIVMIVVELIDRDYDFCTFMAVYGPVIIAILLIFRGRVWLRWLGNRRLGRTLLPERRMRAAVLLLVVGAAAAILPCLGWVSLYDRDEGYYAGCAAEMIDRGDPLVPHFSGEPWLEKPPLGYWAMAASMRILGRTEFAARLPSALAGVLAIWLIFRLASRMYCPRTGGVAAVMLGTSILFSAASRLAILDTFLVCCVLLSMTGFWAFLNGRERWGLFLFYLGCGFGGLTKGPLGVALPVIAVGGYAVWTRSWGLFRRMRPLQGFLLVLTVICVWAVPANWSTQGELLYELVWIRTLRPVFVPLQGHGGGNLWQYLLLFPIYVPVLFLGFLPWTPFLMMGWKHIRNGESWRSKRPAFLLGWAVAQLAVLSLVRTKLAHHVLPILPPLAILSAVALVRLIDTRPSLNRKAVQKWGLRVLLYCLLVGAAAIIAIPLEAGFREDWPWFIPPAFALIMGAWYAGHALRRRRYEHAFIGLTVAMCLCFSLAWQVALPQFEKGKSARRVAWILRMRYPHGELNSIRIGTKSYREMSVVYYLRRPVEKVSDVRAFLSKPSPAVLIIPESKLKETIQTTSNLSYHLLWRKHVWIPEKNRWLDLVIISNQPTVSETVRHHASSPAKKVS